MKATRSRLGVAGVGGLAAPLATVLLVGASVGCGARSSLEIADDEGGGGGGAGSSCGQTSDRFDLELSHKGRAWGCRPGFETATEPVSIEARVHAVVGGELQLDRCPPTSPSCDPILSILRVAAPGLIVSGVELIPIGTYVRVDVTADLLEGCSHRLQIWNLPTWHGVSNPVSQDSGLWLAGVDGQLPSGEAPFSVSALPLGCYPDEQGCDGPKDDYRLRFVEDGSTPNALDLDMGEESDWQLRSSPASELLRVRNLRSYESGECGDHWNWAFVARRLSQSN